ncbi:DUF4153 domain-containing protein [Flavobacterium sp. UMI-01]|uniref:DUF4153 domain-containing protein n=1 Tax=Flavobacterium sp. UMI-01 TaxID=1441053 RepID=UPI001C7D3914|nr:DUF4153 domain-containing protein [Flavobacterium sp. UMI-01]GIZ09203.1 hypothetical protein FUMI01_19300 [Flavobacterium sp. UMI-01]
MVRFPSFQKIIDTTQNTIIRFPLETLTAVLGTIIAIRLSEETYNSPMNSVYTKILLCCSLGLVLFLALSLYFSKELKNNIFRFGWSLILGGIVVLFVFNFSEPLKQNEIFQFLALNLALHLLVSFAAFIHKKYSPDSFWEFNKQLFLRILTAGLYSLVIFAGLSFALLAMHLLFEIEFYDKIYLHLFFIISGIFNTLFFLAGVPEINEAKTSLVLNYPMGLKKFTQYVLVPLISIYLIILLSYELKIIITLSLPIGWVSNLILVFAIFGILSLLLIHPIANEAENVWIATFHKWFYFLLVPLLGLLFWAILYRINLYGFTHERYYVFALALWLSLLTAYFIFRKNPQIQFIPISMSIIAALTIMGPQSADAVSKRSQLNRFETYMLTKKEKLSFKEEQDLSSIIKFLNDNYEIEILIPSAKELIPLIKKDKQVSEYDIMKTLGYQYRSQYESENRADKNFYYSYYNNGSKPIENIQGYDLSFSIDQYQNLDCKNCISLNAKPFSISSEKTQYGIDLIVNTDKIPLHIFNFINTNPKFNKNNGLEIINQKIETDKYNLLLTYKSASGEIIKNKKVVTEYAIDILLKIKTN